MHLPHQLIRHRPRGRRASGARCPPPSASIMIGELLGGHRRARGQSRARPRRSGRSAARASRAKQAATCAARIRSSRAAYAQNSMNSSSVSGSRSIFAIHCLASAGGALGDRCALAHRGRDFLARAWRPRAPSARGTDPPCPRSWSTERRSSSRPRRRSPRPTHRVVAAAREHARGRRPSSRSRVRARPLLARHAGACRSPSPSPSSYLTERTLLR